MTARALGAAARRERGQAAVEFALLAPLLVVVALAVAQLLAAGAASALAGHAAEAGAVALLQGGDPVTAARSALPGWSRRRVVVRGPRPARAGAAAPAVPGRGAREDARGRR